MDSWTEDDKFIALSFSAIDAGSKLDKPLWTQWQAGLNPEFIAQS